jgi:UDP-N-acetylglucosamine 2-epimerase (non-hydrolysing)
VLSQLRVTPRKFFLVTLHRAENVDLVERLTEFISAFRLLTQEFQLPLICSLHPRTRSQLLKNGQTLEEERIIAMQPLGLFDFIRLEQSALCVLSDSGTVQEECCLMHTPNVTLRDVTERPETMEAGSNLITGCRPESIVNAVKLVLDQSRQWHIPEEYLFGNVSETVVKIVLSALPPFSL